MSLSNSLGLEKNPFSKKSSEQELLFLNHIFYKPNYYDTLMETLSSGDSRFIIGQRGHGKSSIINKLFEDLEKKNIFTIKVDRFDSVPVKKNEFALLKLIIKSIVVKLVIYLKKNPKRLRRLNKSEKEKLALFIRGFFDTISNDEFQRTYNALHKIKTRNLITRIINWMGIGLANATTHAFVEISSSVIRKSLGLPEHDTSPTAIEYFKRIEEIKNDKIPSDHFGNTKEKIKQILDEILEIVEKVGFTGTTILFDKIDEYQNLNQDLVRITNFTSEILSDTELLLNDKFAIGFSLWSELRSELAGIVRFDKFGIVDVRWQYSDLTPLINKRLKYFSIKDPVTLDKLIPNENDRDELIKISNKSPRDLISALAEIYLVQANKNPNANSFEPDCISNGLIQFCAGYDYDSITPSKQGKNQEVTVMINKLLQVKLNAFSMRQLTITLNQSTAQSEGQIKSMLKYKLISEGDIHNTYNEKEFLVIEPKVNYLIRRGYSKIE